MNLRAWLLLLSLLITAPQAISEVIVNGDLPTPREDEVRKAFSGRLKQWDSGELVVVFILPRDTLATRKFVLEVLGITPSAFEDLYESIRANQQRTQMRMVETDTQMIRSVASTTGAIGYVSTGLLINTGNGYVKIIPIR